MDEISKVKRLNEEIDKYLDRLQESHKEVAELKTAIFNYLRHVDICEGYDYLEHSIKGVEKLRKIYKEGYINDLHKHNI